MALQANETTGGPPHLTTSRGAALYIGALLGPGLLLLPGLAAGLAGPASILAWIALLVLSGLLAAVFAASGRRQPSAGGVIGYVTAGLGSRAGFATGWMFLTGVVCGAPIVCLIGASYVTDLTGGGQLDRAAVAGGLLLTVVGLAAGGLRASAAAQLVLVSMLTVVVVVASAGSAASARAANWTPFAPHGWLAVGSAAATLMFAFVGWEAVAPLTTRLVNPRRQLPRVIGIALAVTSALYLGLAVATISVLGRQTDTDVPLAGLLASAVGPAGRDIAAVAAVMLTLGATNAYINGAAAMAGQLAHAAPGGRAPRPLVRLLAAITAAGLVLFTLYGLRMVTTAALVAVPTALFLAVYLGAMVAAARALRGPVRLAAVQAALAVVIVLGFCGWALAIPAAVALATGWRPRRARTGAAAPGEHLAAAGSRTLAGRGGRPVQAPCVAVPAVMHGDAGQHQRRRRQGVPGDDRAVRGGGGCDEESLPDRRVPGERDGREADGSGDGAAEVGVTRAVHADRGDHSHGAPPGQLGNQRVDGRRVAGRVRRDRVGHEAQLRPAGDRQEGGSQQQVTGWRHPGRDRGGLRQRPKGGAENESQRRDGGQEGQPHVTLAERPVGGGCYVRQDGEEHRPGQAAGDQRAPRHRPGHGPRQPWQRAEPGQPASASVPDRLAGRVRRAIGAQDVRRSRRHLHLLMRRPGS
jgi:amino acid efflux transporter